MLSDKLVNPFDNTPESDLPHAITVMPLWTEHYCFFGYDATHQFGMFVHIGRMQEKPKVWRSVLEIYLPGEDLLVLKTFGEGDERGPGAGPLKITCIEPFKLWTIDFDGAAFSTTRSKLMHEIFRDGPSEFARFHMVFEAAGPLHELRPGKELTAGMTVATFHTSQILHMRGDAEFRGKKVRLNGMGARDHSEGPRDYGPVYGDLWFHALFPSGKVVHVQHVTFQDFEYKSGYLFRGDGSPMEEIEPLEMPYVHHKAAVDHTVDCDPVMGMHRKFRIVINTSKGKEVLEGELITSHAITYFSVMEEFIGTALDRRGGIQMCDAPARVRCNGEEGIALHERASRTEGLRPMKK